MDVLGTTEVAEDPGLNGCRDVGRGAAPGNVWPSFTRWLLAVEHYLSTRLLLDVDVHVASVCKDLHRYCRFVIASQLL